MEQKYYCEQCHFECQHKSTWERHIETILHKTGKRKQRCDIKDPYKCDICGYVTKNIVIFKDHRLTKHGNADQRKQEYKYYCEYCDFGTFCEKEFVKHTQTKKHTNFINILKK